jgi:hypothetical protein
MFISQCVDYFWSYIGGAGGLLIILDKYVGVKEEVDSLSVMKI